MSAAIAPPNPTAIVGPPVIHHGVVNASHTSSVALVYLTSTMPTPWPFHLASMVLSLLTVFMALIAFLVHEEHRRHRTAAPMRSALKATATAGISSGFWRLARRVARYTPLLITSARTAGTLSLAVRFVQQHGQSRRPALSNVAALIFSTLPNTVGYRAPLARMLAAAEVLVLFASAFIVGGMRDSSSAAWYGELVGAGRCPLALSAKDLHASYIGCGLDTVGDYYNVFDLGLVAAAETVLNVYIAFLLYLGMIGYSLVWFLMQLPAVSRDCCRLLGRLRRPGSSDSVRSDASTLNEMTIGARATNAGPPDNRDQRKPEELDGPTSCSAAIVGIMLYTVIFFPIHHAQLTQHGTASVFDSYGPLVRAGDMYPAGALAGTSWSDWFNVEQPADKFGFITVWWKEHGRHWDTLLAFL